MYLNAQNKLLPESICPLDGAMAVENCPVCFTVKREEERAGSQCVTESKIVYDIDGSLGN